MASHRGGVEQEILYGNEEEEMSELQKASSPVGVAAGNTADRRSLPVDWPVSGYMAVLRQHAPEIYERNHIKSLGVFGSYARNEQHQGSDLDLLVEFSQPPTLFQFCGLEIELSDLLGVEVDLVMRDGLKPGIAGSILRDLVPL